MIILTKLSSLLYQLYARIYLMLYMPDSLKEKAKQVELENRNMK